MRHVPRYVARTRISAGEHIALSEQDARHLIRIVRRGVGDEIEIISSDGQVWPAIVTGCGDSVIAEIGTTPRPVHADGALTLFQGLCEWGRLDTVVEKGVELGLSRIAFFAGTRSQRIPDAAAFRRRRERFGRVMEAASRQSGRGQLPECGDLLRFDEVVAACAGTNAILLDPRGTQACADVAARYDADDPIAVIIGPDTGLSEHEVSAARDAGIAVCHLGDTTLRAETAAIVAVSVVLAVTGRMSHARVNTHLQGDAPDD